MSEENTRSPGGTRDREGARKRALNYFTVAEQRDSDVRKEIQRERDATVAKTAKLRALRLEKEAADRAAAAEQPAAPRPRKIKRINTA